MSPLGSRFLLFLIAGWLSVCPDGEVYGWNWSMDSSVSLKGEYNDNLRLSDRFPAEVWGKTVSPAMTWNVLGERNEVRGNLSAGWTGYSGPGEDIRSKQALLDLISSFAQDRHTWNLGGGYRSDLTLDRELQETGLVHTQTTRRVWRANGSWDLKVSEAGSLTLAYEGNVVRYPDAASDLFDYNVHSGTMTFSRNLRDGDRVQATAYYTDDRIPDIRGRFAETGGRIGFQRFFSESLQGSLSGGLFRERTVVENGPRDRLEGWLAEGTLEQKYEATVLRGSVSRRNLPSGGGSPVQVDRFSLGTEKALSSAQTVSLGADFYRTKFFRNDLLNPAQRYASAEAIWNWRVREKYSMRVSYRYAAQRDETTSRTAESHAVYFMATFYGKTVGKGF